MMKSLVRMLRRAFGAEKDIERIMSPISKILKDLDGYQNAQMAEKVKRDNEAAVLAARSRSKRDAASLCADKAREAAARREKMESFFA